MFDDNYPRVLVINGEPISAATATGLTMENLFAGWPAENLAQIVTSSLAHERRFAWEYLLQPMERRGLNWLRPRPHNGLSDASDSPVVAPRNGNSRSGLRAGLRKWLDLVPYELPAQVEKRIVQFRPDVIYTCLGNIQISRMALHCAALCGIRIVPHFMDDWIPTMYAGRPDLLVQRRRLLSIVRRVIRGAPVCLAISELMAAEYSSTYCVPFHSFMNCMMVPAAAEPESAVDAAIGPRLVYVGGLHLGRWRSLRQIGAALASLHADGVAGKLSVYAPARDIAEYRDKLAGSSIEIAGSLAQHEVMGVLRGGQVTVHAESFEQKIRSYTRLSMSTKIPQYMAAARPILCYGPGEVASCQFIGENACGLVVDSQSKPELAAALRRLLEDPSLRKQLGENGWRVARKKFNAEDVRQRFRALIAEVAGHQGSSQMPLARGR